MPCTHLALHELQQHCTHGFCIMQKSESGLKAAQSSAGQSGTAGMPNGSHAEAADASEQSEEEEVTEATAAKRHLLIKAAPLAGLWGLERFGLADITVLKMMEALPG